MIFFLCQTNNTASCCWVLLVSIKHKRTINKRCALASYPVNSSAQNYSANLHGNKSAFEFRLGISFHFRALCNISNLFNPGNRELTVHVQVLNLSLLMTASQIAKFTIHINRHMLDTCAIKISGYCSD